ncbi:hypothetical protein D3C75_630040 [compost metagenome]
MNIGITGFNYFGKLCTGGIRQLVIQEDQARFMNLDLLQAIRACSYNTYNFNFPCFMKHVPGSMSKQGMVVNDQCFDG